MKHYSLKRLLALLLTLAAAAAVIPCGCASGGEGTAMVNTVVFVGLGGQPFPEDKAEEFMRKLTGEGGVASFFAAESLGKLRLTSRRAASVVLEEGEEAFLSGSGYDNTVTDGKKNVDAFMTEQRLVRKILSLADLGNGRGKDVADGNGDGVADGILFVFDANMDDPAQDILWPHKSEFYAYGEYIENAYRVPQGYFAGDPAAELALPEVCGAVAGAYLILPASAPVGDICHEYGHVLGLADYYSYESPSDFNLGDFELMGQDPHAVPQFSLSYLRMKLGWLKEGEEVASASSGGTFTLAPVTRGKLQAVRIIPADFAQKHVYFMVEARGNEGFDASLSSHGLILTAVEEENAFIGPSGPSSQDYGNMYGEPEIRLMLTASLGLTVEEGDAAYLGDTHGISLTNIIKNADGSYTFTLTTGEEKAKPLATSSFAPQAVSVAGGRAAAVEWQPFDGKVYIMALEKTGRVCADEALGYLPSEKDVVSGKTRRETVFYGVSDGRLCRWTAGGGDLLVVLVATDGKDSVRRVVSVGKSDKTAAFGDFAASLLTPPRPAFIVAVCLAAALAGVVALTAVYAAKKAHKPPETHE